MWDWGGKPTSQKMAIVLRARAALLEIGCQKRSIDKKPPNPNKKQGGKTERLGLGFFSSNPEPALPLQRRIEQFDYCELPSGQVSRSFLVVLGDFVDLVCSCSRSSRSCKLNAYCRESHLMHQRAVVSFVGLMFTWRAVTVFVGLIRTARRVTA